MSVCNRLMIEMHGFVHSLCTSLAHAVHSAINIVMEDRRTIQKMVNCSTMGWKMTGYVIDELHIST